LTAFLRTATDIPTVSAAAQHAMGTDALGGLPLAFAENEGQADPATRFLAQGANYSLALTPDAMLVSLTAASCCIATAPAPVPTALRFSFPGANPIPILDAAEPLPGTVNYLIGADPAHWRTNVPTTAQVRYRDLYPGIDLLVYGTAHGAWEYDVIVAPGADATAFTLAIDGATAIARDDASGDLMIRIAGEVRLCRSAKPAAVPQADGSITRRATCAAPTDQPTRIRGTRRPARTLATATPLIGLIILHRKPRAFEC
jgi:hypothetical protein